MTIFLVIFSIVGWLLALCSIVFLGIISLAFMGQESRLNELKGDLEVMTRRANLFEPKGENEDF